MADTSNLHPTMAQALKPLFVHERAVIRTAEYTGSTTRRPFRMLTLYLIRNGRREFVQSHTVSGKREARAIAQKHGFTPWNF